MFRFLFFIILIFCFININTGTLVFLVIASLFNAYILFCQKYLKNSRIVNLDKIELNTEERNIVKKYHLYFRFPFAAKGFAATASGIYIFGLVLFVWLLIHSFWISSMVILLNSIIAASLRPKLDPLFSFHYAVEKSGKKQYQKEMELLDSASAKIFQFKNKTP